MNNINLTKHEIKNSEKFSIGLKIVALSNPKDQFGFETNTFVFCEFDEDGLIEYISEGNLEFINEYVKDNFNVKLNIL